MPNVKVLREFLWKFRAKTFAFFSKKTLAKVFHRRIRAVFRTKRFRSGAKLAF